MVWRYILQQCFLFPLIVLTLLWSRCSCRASELRAGAFVFIFICKQAINFILISNTFDSQCRAESSFSFCHSFPYHRFPFLFLHLFCGLSLSWQSLPSWLYPCCGAAVNTKDTWHHRLTVSCHNVAVQGRGVVVVVVGVRTK